jgi:crotonobetainyl-CoA:carnitine CoA-transferase CaiB-like acyl-CoA transferase
MEELQSHGIAAGAVLSAPEWLTDPHLVARDYFVELLHKETGKNRWDGSPVLFAGERGYEAWSATPLFGEHNALILSALGYTREQIESLRLAGVIAQEPRHE